jgi:hypothetical protein
LSGDETVGVAGEKFAVAGQALETDRDPVRGGVMANEIAFGDFAAPVMAGKHVAGLAVVKNRLCTGQAVVVFLRDKAATIEVIGVKGDGGHWLGLFEVE